MPDDPVAPAPSVGWTKLYHPNGALVSLPVWAGTPGEMLRCVGDYVEAGFLVVAPGLEEGEQKETVGWVLRGEFEKDGETTPYVLLYADNPALEWSFLKVYLNTDADVTAFEHAAGVRLDSLPAYIGQDKPKRGASKQIDRYIVRVRPFGVVFKNNPKYDEAAAKAAQAKGEVYKVPARLFVRWGEAKGGSGTAAGAPADTRTQENPFAAEVAEWRAFLAGDPPLADVTARVLVAARTPGLLAALKEVVEDWKARSGATWDDGLKSFVPPYDPDQNQEPIPF